MTDHISLRGADQRKSTGTQGKRGRMDIHDPSISRDKTLLLNADWISITYT